MLSIDLLGEDQFDEGDRALPVLHIPEIEERCYYKEARRLEERGKFRELRTVT